MLIKGEYELQLQKKEGASATKGGYGLLYYIAARRVWVTSSAAAPLSLTIW